MQPTATVMNKGLIGIINHYGWTKVGLITWRDSFFSVVRQVINDKYNIAMLQSHSQVADHFKRLLTENTITFSERLLAPDGSEINEDPFVSIIHLITLYYNTL